MMTHFALAVEIQSLLPEVFGAICVLFAGWFWGRWRAQRDWVNKQFKNRLTVSLNCFEYEEVPGEKEGEKKLKTALRLRTLFESDLYEMFHNESMVSLVKKAIDRVERGSPLLSFEKDDAWHLLNTVLNQVSERFSNGIVKKDMGLSVTSRWYTFCLTYEIEDEVRTNKPRVMVMERDKFAKFPEEGEVDIESPHHATRVKTLRYLKQQRRENPHLFMDMEVVI